MATNTGMLIIALTIHGLSILIQNIHCRACKLKKNLFFQSATRSDFFPLVQWTYSTKHIPVKHAKRNLSLIKEYIRTPNEFIYEPLVLKEGNYSLWEIFTVFLD
jgi:hypothetical protein